MDLIKRYDAKFSVVILCDFTFSFFFQLNYSCNHLILPCTQNSTMSQVEFRRQIHIQSEQKRRAEIKDGFEELRRQLPTTYTGRKLSKAVLLQKGI